MNKHLKAILYIIAGFNPEIDMTMKEQLKRSLFRKRRYPEIWIYYPENDD